MATYTKDDSAPRPPRLWELTALEAVELLKTGKVTPTALIDAARDRILDTDHNETYGVVNATPIRCFDEAYEAARKLESKGHPANPGPGYLYGLPILVKDATAVKGILWTEGCTLYKDRIATSNDPMVDNLLQNGAIVMGKTNVPEFSAGSHTYNMVFGCTCNPWDVTKSAGGSSGGSAAALAVGQAWMATGADLGGSLRIPAAFCGVVGFRTSHGVVPRNPPAAPVDVESLNGPMARNVPDLALFLDAMAGQHSSDPRSSPAPAMPFSEAVRPGVLPLPSRVAWSPDLGGIALVDPDVARVCADATAWFETVGATVMPACPDLSDARDIFQVLRAAAYANSPLPDEAIWRASFKPELIWQIDKGLALSPAEVDTAREKLAAYQNRVADFFSEYDILACPTAIVQPFDIDTKWVEEAQGQVYDNYVDWLIMTFAFSLIDAPSISIPAGYTHEPVHPHVHPPSKRLPVGLQLIGRKGGDAALLAAAAAFERGHTFASEVPRNPGTNRQ